MDDASLVDTLNDLTGAGLTLRTRSAFGKLGGAIFVDRPDGRPAVVTVFHGDLVEARHTAETLNILRGGGWSVARHDLVVDLGDQVVLVQERLPDGPPRPLTARRIEAIVEINDRFADAAHALPGIPPVAAWFRPGLLPGGDVRAERIAARISELTDGSNADLLEGDDVVHVDLSPVNVLFDSDDHATAVVDWNLGIFRGDRRLALVQTRFDREWFVQRHDADPFETAAAHHLDDILADRIDPATLRVFWAYWLRHHLIRASQHGDPTIIDWQLSLAESRLG